MADYPTGRTRTCGITAQASFSGDGVNNASSGAWNCGAGVAVTFFGSVAEADPTYFDPTFATVRVRPRADITVTFTGGGAGNSCNVVVNDTWFGPWLVVSSGFDFSGAAFGNGVGTGSGTLTASLVLDEYLSDLADGTYIIYERLRSASLSSSMSFSIPCTWHSSWYGPVGFTLSGSGSNAVTVDGSTLSDSRQLNYTRSLTLNAQGTIIGQVTVSCPGIGYSPTMSYASAHGSLSGDSGNATLTGSTGRTAGATLTSEPDWGIAGVIYNKVYKDASALPGVVANLVSLPNTGLPVVVASGTAGADGIAHVSYTASPYFHWVFNDGWGLSDSSQSVTTGNSLFITPTTGTDALQIYFDPDWADSYGVELTSQAFSGNGKVCGLNVSAPFSGGSFTVDQTHTFRHFGQTTGWTNNSTGLPATYATLDSGTLKFAINTAANGFSSKTVGFNDGGTIKPHFYRYYKFRAKASVDNASFSLNLFTSYGGTNNSTYTYNFTTGPADTWTNLEFDFAFPHVFDEQQYTARSIYSRHVLHPGAIPRKGFDSMWITCNSDNTSYWFDTLQGFHKPNTPGTTDRLPLFTLEGVNANSYSNNGVASLDGNTTSINSTIQPGGPWGKFIVNGVQGLSFGGTQPDMLTDMRQIRDLYDNATTPPSIYSAGSIPNDTGFHVVIGGAPQLSRTVPASGYAVNGLPFHTRNMDGGTDAIPVNAQRKSNACFGYYGMGDSNGAYDSALTYTAERWWSGELQGILYSASAPSINTPVTVLNEAGTALETVSTNRDGFFRHLDRYGVPYPRSNTPLTATITSRQQYTADATAHQQIISYTSLGLHFTGYKLKCQKFRYKDTSGLCYYSPNWSDSTFFPNGLMRFGIIDKSASYVDLECGSGGGVNHLESKHGELMALTPGVNIGFDRSNFSVPPFDTVTANITGITGDTNPFMALEANGRIHVLFTRASTGQILEIYSDDEGATWSTPAVMFTNGDYPVISISPLTGEIVRACYMPDSTIHATVVFPGDITTPTEFSFKDSTNTALLWEPTGYSLAQAYETSARWTLWATKKGDTSPTFWVSGDFCQTWTQIAF